MVKFHLYIVFAIGLSITHPSSIFCQKNLPEFSGIDLLDHRVNFPKDIIGKKTLIGFAMSRKSQIDLESWAQPVYDEFIDKESLASLVYDAHVYLIIVFNQMNGNFRNKLEKELKENLLEEFYSNVILCDDDAKMIKNIMEIEDDDVPVLFTLNSDGEITSINSGHYTENKMEKMASFLEIED